MWVTKVFLYFRFKENCSLWVFLIGNKMKNVFPARLERGFLIAECALSDLSRMFLIVLNGNG